MQDIAKNNFDFLRVLLAFIVFVGHLGGLSAVPELKILEHSPVELAVYGFFIVSGFLIGRSYERTTTFKRYLKKRFNRIFPAYFLVICLSTVFLSLVSTLPISEYFTRPQTYKYFFWNSIFLNFKAPYLPGVFGNQAVNGALWTLKVEVAFYLVVPLIFLLFGKNNRFRNLSLIVLYFLSITFLNYCELSGQIKLTKQLPSTLCYFIGGMLVYFNFEKFIQKKHLLFIIAVLTVWLDYYVGKTFLGNKSLVFLSPMMMSIIVLYFVYSFKYLNNFGKYGDFTYGIYIFHFPIIRTFQTLGLFENYNPWVMAVLCLLVVCTVGILSWNYFEKRFL